MGRLDAAYNKNTAMLKKGMLH
ncbi:hypothetical protein B14911_02229 [Bacillus sp. NRRL B-14911]|nr:hypothetical protein B14911_02229 [Bacillus sp. NRRL B-14911]